jgi:hypothetical protein
MRVIFSRKGFDSAAGKAPSPIIDGVPISLPIPTERRSKTTYRLVGLGDLVEQATKGRIGSDNLCHEDPVFSNGRCVLGQTGAAQSHLENTGVGVGDVFLFFGLFASPEGQDRHHRIFGYLQVDEVRRLGGRPSDTDNPEGFLRRHPHTIGEWNENNTLYLGSGAKARNTHPLLRLSKSGGPVSVWSIPTWLKAAGLTYHGNQSRWVNDNELSVASRGQEIGNAVPPQEWLHAVIATIDWKSP